MDVPVFLSSGRIDIPVEVQFRTIAMDFWAALEHKIYYKYDRAVPAELLSGLREAADTAAELDVRMERLHREIRGGEPGAAPAAEVDVAVVDAAVVDVAVVDVVVVAESAPAHTFDSDSERVVRSDTADHRSPSRGTWI